jgi:putative transcriptional regulator
VDAACSRDDPATESEKAEMIKRTASHSRSLRDLLATLKDLRAHGMVSKRQMDSAIVLCGTPPAYPPERVLCLRRDVAKMNEVVFAALLNVSVSTLKQWESPTSNAHPIGAAAKLLHLLETKGVEGLMT